MNFGDLRYVNEMASFLQQADPRVVLEVCLIFGLWGIWHMKGELINVLKGQVSQLEAIGRQKDRILNQLKSKVKLLEGQLSQSNLDNRYESSSVQNATTQQGEQVVERGKAKDRRRGKT